MKKIITILISLIFFLPACVKDSQLNKNNSTKKTVAENQTNSPATKHGKQKQTLTKKIKTLPKQELDFKVKNVTGKTIYAACFSYIPRNYSGHWRWDKSEIYEIKNNQSQFIDIDTIKDPIDRKNVYGSLAVFYNLKDAQDSIYELLSEKNRLDLDKLYKLKKQTVNVGVEKYGFKKEQLDVEITDSKYDIKTSELDFSVENKTGKNLWVCCFVYQKQEGEDVWRFDKTELILIKNNESAIIDVDTIKDDYNRVFSSGFLGVFEEKDKKEAEDSTYELLLPENKIALGKLTKLKNKKIVLNIEKYGIKNDFIDVSTKSTIQTF
jgi:hypothetical protein